VGEQLFIRLPELSERLGLPEDWLRERADRGEIPSLRVGRSRMFCPEIVFNVLAGKAADDAKRLRDDIEAREWVKATFAAAPPRREEGERG
jgi:hypothetical protein